MQSQSWATKWAHEVAICRLPYRRFLAIFSADRVDRIESSDASVSKWVMSSAARWAAIIASFSLAPLSRVTLRSLTTFSFTLSRSEFTVIYLLSNLLIAELARSAEAGVKRAKPPPRQKLRNWVFMVDANLGATGALAWSAQSDKVFQRALDLFSIVAICNARNCAPVAGLDRLIEARQESAVAAYPQGAGALLRSRRSRALSRAYARKRATWPNSRRSRTAVFSSSKIIARFACAGFRMPAHRNVSARFGAGVRKPPGKEPAGAMWRSSSMAI